MLSKIKDNPVVLYLILGGGMLLVVMGVTLWNHAGDKQELKEKHTALSSELNGIEHDIAVRQAEIDDKKMKVIQEVTGLDPELVSIDKNAAKKYFKPAFSWKNADDYNQVRKDYIASLGKGNSFTKTYLPPDTVIETNDGELSYIDHKNLKVTMHSVRVVPLTAVGDSVRYVAFIKYFMHKDSNDLANTDALEPSEAIIEFTATGDSSNRHVTEVSARAGFSSSTER